MNEVESGICTNETLVYISLRLPCFLISLYGNEDLAGKSFFYFSWGLTGLMGIVNLLPQLRSITETKTLSCFKGLRVGIDIMCWLVQRRLLID